MLIMVEEKTIVRDLEVIITSNKDKSQQSAQLAKRMIEFLNSKSTQELRTMEINKMLHKDIYRKNFEIKLGGIKKSIFSCNSYFDKRIKGIFPSCLDQ